MKKLIITSAIALLLAGGSTITAQDLPQEYLGLPGDNLNLYAVMNLFQESATLEGFERSLNDPESRINNLDLNGDNMVDYILVFDYVDDNVHNIVMRVALNQSDYQDVAVFIVERFKDGSVQIQLVGDEALYGKNYIIEPIYDETPNPGYTGTAGNAVRVAPARTTYYEVSYWPVISYIYHPTYVVYRSAWYWDYWPVYWSPWRPHYWHFYYGYHYNWFPHYYNRYRICTTVRWNRYTTYYYTSVRRYSPLVVVNINSGKYKSTYSRPEQRRHGEALYASVQSRRATGSQSATEVANQSRRSTGTVTSNTSATGRAAGNNRTAVQGNSADRRAASGTTSNRTSVSNTSRNSGTVSTANTGQRRAATSTQTQRNTSTAVQRGSSTGSNNSTGRATTIQRGTSSSSSRGAATVQRNTTSSSSRGAATVQRGSSSSSSRGTTTINRNTSSSSSRGTTTINRNTSNNSSRGSATVSKGSSNSSSRGSATVSKGSSGSSRSSGTVNRSTGNSSSSRSTATVKKSSSSGRSAAATSSGKSSNSSNKSNSSTGRRTTGK